MVMHVPVQHINKRLRRVRRLRGIIELDRLGFWELDTFLAFLRAFEDTEKIRAILDEARKALEELDASEDLE